MSDNGKAITIAQPRTFESMLQEAETLVKSGFLPSAVNTPEKALAIMTMARELGIGMWAGFNGINVIQGKPTISPQLMLGLINKSGQLEDIQITPTDEIAATNSCTVIMTRRGRSAHSETFTMAMAAAMNLSNKDNWRKQGAVMLKWRAVAACARVVFPDVIIGFYTPEEIDPNLIVDEDGVMQNAPFERQEHPTIDAEYEQPSEPHWIEDAKLRAGFWAWTKEQGLTHAQVHSILGVTSLKLYADTLGEAKTVINKFLASHASQVLYGAEDESIQESNPIQWGDTDS